MLGIMSNDLPYIISFNLHSSPKRWLGRLYWPPPPFFSFLALPTAYESSRPGIKSELQLRLTPQLQQVGSLTHSLHWDWDWTCPSVVTWATAVGSLIHWITAGTLVLLFFFCPFYGQHLRHMGVPGPGVEIRITPGAYAPALAILDLSCICELNRQLVAMPDS